MTPGELSAESFEAYPPASRTFAVQHLSLLRKLPLAICPSFLDQIKRLQTSFPAERESLQWQCDALAKLSAEQYANLTAPLFSLVLSPALQTSDWVHAPAAFVADLTAHLWSSGQLNQFRAATRALFASIPQQEDSTERLVIVLLGSGAKTDSTQALRKLRKHGVLLTAFDQSTLLQQLSTLMDKRTDATPHQYATWYVDGGSPNPKIVIATGAVTVSYPGLSPVRERVLHRMQANIASGTGGAEQMRTHIAEMTRAQAGAAAVTDDPVLQRFYTELFTQSSGPQIFSTSFVQWTGRELARRVQPHTVLLRYAPRQRHRDLNELFAETTDTELDPQSSFRDAEMGTYYNWIEMHRVCAPGKLTFVAVVEDHRLAVVLAKNGTPGSVVSTPLTLQGALERFA